VVAGEHAGDGGARPTPVMAKGDRTWLGLESGSGGKAAGAAGGGKAEAFSEGGSCLREGDIDLDGEGERERERVGEREEEAAEGEGDGDSGRKYGGVARRGMVGSSGRDCEARRTRASSSRRAMVGP
jgi:hypothetical protein